MSETTNQKPTCNPPRWANGVFGFMVAGELRLWIKARLPVLAAILLATISVGCRKVNQLSGGMAPTITNNEPVTINYLAYAVSSPRRWDVVALFGPAPTLPNSSIYLKRVIALPGETISLSSTGIVVNGTLLEMPRLYPTLIALQKNCPSSIWPG